MATRAAPYAFKAFQAYRKGGVAGVKRYGGRLIRKAATNTIRKYTGYGSYSEVGNRGMNGQQAPKITNGALDEGCIVISHKEYLGEVYSSSDKDIMAVASYKLNPGNEESFPFLSKIANNFQEYRFEGLCFTFRSMYADATAVSQASGTPSTNAQGSVVMATQYDPTEERPTAKQEIVNMEYSQTAKPSETMMHFVECKKGASPLTNLYIAATAESQKGDERFYNFGTFNIATLGIPAEEAVLGELWVSYQVRLYKPRLIINSAANQRYFFWGAKGTNVALDESPFGVVDMINATNQAGYCYAGTNYFPTKWYKGTNNLGDYGYVEFPGTRFPKSYIVQLHYIGSARAAAPGSSNFTNITLDSSIFATGGEVAGSNAMFAPQDALAGTTKVTWTYALSQTGTQLNDQPWRMTFSTKPTLPDSPAQFKMFVTEIPYQGEIQNN